MQLGIIPPFTQITESFYILTFISLYTNKS